jgi:hypothetical protein
MSKRKRFLNSSLITHHSSLFLHLRDWLCDEHRCGSEHFACGDTEHRTGRVADDALYVRAKHGRAAEERGVNVRADDD